MSERMPDFMALAVRKYEPGSVWRGKKTDRTRTVVEVTRDGVRYRTPAMEGSRVCWFTTWDQWVGERVS